jgi:integrase
MGRPSKPWFRASKGTWYCTVEGKKVSLGVRGKENHAKAIRAWHRLMAEASPEEGGQAPEATPEAEPIARPEAEPTVGEVINAFLADCEGRIKSKTVRWYRGFLEPFAARHGEGKASALTPVQAEAYSRQQGWADASQCGFLGTLVSAFRWAVRARMLTSNPLMGTKTPPKPSRGAETLVTPEEHRRLVENASPTFALFLRVLYATGARPGEVARITAENFDQTNACVCLKEHKTARKGKTRTLYLPPEVVALLVKQRERYPTGPLLRTLHGKAWGPSVIVRAMIQTRKRAGIPHAVCYGLRHTFATDALANGVPDAQVAALLGHSGTTMLHRHYSHLTEKAQALRAALGQVRK